MPFSLLQVTDMNEIRKVRVQDASRIKSVIGFDTVAAAQDHIRKNIYYTDESFSVLARSSYTSKYSVTVRFIGSVDDVFADALLKFLFFSKDIYKVSVIISVDDAATEHVLVRNGFVQEAVLHEELYENDSFVDAGLFYITLPMYKQYSVGFLPFQRGVIAVSGGVDFVDDVTFLRFDETPSNEYIRRCADHCGLITDGKMRPRGDEFYKEYKNEDVPAEVQRALTQIREYLLKKRQSFDINVKTGNASEFKISVWACIKKIPYGYTISYEDIALELAGGDIKKARKLTRAVGHACAENPVPIIVPCHRVIGKNGKLVGFKDGVEFKDFLLTHELFAAMPLA